MVSNINYVGERQKQYPVCSIIKGVKIINSSAKSSSDKLVGGSLMILCEEDDSTVYFCWLLS